MTNSKIAVVRVRGMVNLNHDIKATMKYLRLHKKNACIVIEDNPSNKGMVLKVRDYVTFGNIDDETLKILQEKGEKKFYSLNPPKKGFGRKGIKVPFTKGGALGDRKEKINDIIRRMV